MRAKEFVVEFAPTGIYKPPTIPREPGRDPFGDDPRSQMVRKIQQLLDAGKSVFVSIPGARGRAVGTRIGDEYTWLNVRYRDFLKPKSRTRAILTVPLNTDNDADLVLSPGPRDRFIQTTGKPFDYILTARPGLNIDNSDFFLEEAFDQPYPITWERSEADESVDALAHLPDGSNLSIMFNQDLDDDGQGIYSVEFWRDNSQEVTGAGDSQRVFATVLAAIAQFIEKRKPEQLYFSANKDVEPGQKSGTRSNLYTSLVRRYASAWGYDADISDFAGSTTYKLHRLYEQSSIEENIPTVDPDDEDQPRAEQPPARYAGQPRAYHVLGYNGTPMSPAMRQFLTRHIKSARSPDWSNVVVVEYDPQWYTHTFGRSTNPTLQKIHSWEDFWNMILRRYFVELQAPRKA